MATSMSFKEFMDQVEECLKTSSPDTLREILIEWAKSTHPSKRSEFLARLVPPSQREQITALDEELLEEISELAERVENGDYCEGWGWDEEIREERDWGDESWAAEVDEFFTRVHEAMMEGHYKLARDAYARLFDILEMGEEPGHLPGSPDPKDMLETDLDEARACYLRSVYLVSPRDKRPAKLLEAMQRFRYQIGDELNLQSIINADLNSLPDFSQFLSRWKNLLKTRSEHSAGYLLREAVVLSGGTSAIAQLAREEGKRHPRAYVDWIKALEKEGNYGSMLEAAREGLASVPKDKTVRAEIGEGMIRAGELLDDKEVQLVGWREAFYSSPSLSYLLPLLSVAEQRDCFKEEMETAIFRIVSLLKRAKKYEAGLFMEDSDERQSAASESLLNQAYLLAGRYEDAFHLCENKGALGWSFGRNPKGLVIPFFLKLLSRGKNQYPTKNGELLWKEALAVINGYSFHTQNVEDHFRKAMDGVFQSVQLSEDEENRYMRWCIEETGRRVDAIVGEKHRRSYYKAANLLVALAEVCANRGVKSDGASLIEQYGQKYHRHSAFKKELNVAVKRSGVFT
ncbi:MAG: hypothetical protein ACE5OR_07115 [bacterium]